MTMKNTVAGLCLVIAAGVSSAAYADSYTDTINTFKQAGDSATYFKKAYAYAVFPTVGEGGFIVGAAIGKGRVYVHRHLVGNTTMTQLSAGFQAGGKAYSQIIFFESGSFEFAADASVTAITASAGGSAGTTGATADASGTVNNATTASSGYNKGMAVFTLAKGGLMYAATLAGQRYSYTPRGEG
jgi:hypothetical protein